MKPDWDKLMTAFKDTPGALVADVDCTAGGKALCDKVGVKGYPTIKHGDPDDLQDYKGGRDYAALKKFADENLKPLCSPANIELCDAEQKAKIEALQAMPAEELDAKIAELEQKQKDADTTFNTELEKLQKTYQELNTNKEAKLEEIKNSGLGLMKSVEAHAKKAKAEL